MKKGFTLSEILITIGIVGVVSAIVVPNISAKITRNTIGSSLARAVELTETGMANIIQTANDRTDEANISTLSALRRSDFGGNNNVLLVLQNNRDTLLGDLTISYTNLQTATPPNGYDNRNGNVYQFKKVKSYLIYVPNAVNLTSFVDRNGITRAVEPNEVIRNVFLDANGADQPNELGKDIFLFGLTDSGHLVPAGSQAYNNNIWNGSIQMNCGGDTIPTGNDANGNDMRLSCAARVVNDGYKINYNY